MIWDLLILVLYFCCNFYWRERRERRKQNRPTPSVVYFSLPVRLYVNVVVRHEPNLTYVLRPLIFRNRIVRMLRRFQRKLVRFHRFPFFFRQHRLNLL